MSYPKLVPCSICGKYPDLLKVQDEYKYVDDISWNRRAKGGWENYA